MTPLVLIALLAIFITLISSSRTRTFAFAMLGVLFVVAIIGVFKYRAVEATHLNREALKSYTKAARNSRHYDANTKTVAYSTDSGTGLRNAGESAGWPDAQEATLGDRAQSDDQTVVHLAGDSARAEAVWLDNSANYSGSLGVVPGVVAPSISSAPAAKTWFALGVVVLVGVAIVGGLSLVIALFSKPGTRVAGIVLLSVGAIIALFIGVGAFWYSARSEFGGPATVADLSSPAESFRPPQIPVEPQKPMTPAPIRVKAPALVIAQGPITKQPPATNPAVMPVQPAPPDHEPDSKEMLNAYQSAMTYYRKALSQPLNLEIKDELKEKVSTLKINVQDLGQVTISGSSLVINSIGQAIAKAMTERMKQNNPDITIDAANADANQVAKAIGPAGNSATGPAANSEHATWKKEASTNESTAKDASRATAKLPAEAAETAQPVSTAKPAATELADTSDAPKLPDWVGKQAFLWRASKRADLPDYYAVVNTNPPDGDAYIMNVKTDPYTTIQECEARIPEALQSAVDQYVGKSPALRENGHVQLSLEQLRQLVVADCSELWQSQSLLEPMHRVHLLLKFDQKAREFIKNAQHDRLFVDRASVAGTGFIGLWLILAVCWGYLKLDLATKGAYRTRLRVTATLATLTIAWIIIAVLRTLA
jgi:hypothetical protein